MEAICAWLANVSTNLVGSLLGAGFGVWLALQADKSKAKAAQRADSLQLVGALVVELRKLYDDMTDQYKGTQNTFDTPILETSAKQQVEVFAGDPELLRNLGEVRRLSKLTAQKTYVAMLAHVEALKENPVRPGPGNYERVLLEDIRTHKDHLKSALESCLWDMATILELQINGFPKDDVLRGIQQKPQKQDIMRAAFKTTNS